MEQPENQLSGNQEESSAFLQSYEPKPNMVLLIQLGLFILGMGTSAIVYNMVCLAAGWDPSTSLNADSLSPDRWQVRLQLGLGHLFAFGVSGWLTVSIFYRSLSAGILNQANYLGIRKAPGLTMSGLAILLMTVSIPFVLYSLNINKLIPIPDSFIELERQTEEAIKGLLHMDNVWELLANLCIIALFPALFEELVFRGVVQKQIMRKIGNPWLAIFVASLIFSLAHFQLEGLLPRMFLGVLLGYLYWETKNLWVPIIAHFFNNGIQVVGQYLYNSEVSTVDLEKDITVPFAFALISLFMTLVVMRLIRQTRNGKVVPKP
ncbi:MAG: CPBP family intramembrane metalloprotease [Saprospiraceae bacterium]|nr:CPBP family intramembrane metalloprotease [Saprospiraceae bacterium]